MIGRWIKVKQMTEDERIWNNINKMKKMKNIRSIVKSSTGEDYDIKLWFHYSLNINTNQ